MIATLLKNQNNLIMFLKKILQQTAWNSTSVSYAQSIFGLLTFVTNNEPFRGFCSTPTFFYLLFTYLQTLMDRNIFSCDQEYRTVTKGKLDAVIC